MAIKNRELSQFASLLVVTNVGKDISIAPDENSLVGIGTDSTEYKLHVNGSTNITGDIVVGGDANFTGIVTADSYFDAFGNQLTSFDSWNISGPDVYRLGGVGIGTSVITESLTVNGNILSNGNISASRFISTTTDQSPLQVLSQIRVTNLNADYLREGVPGGNNPSDIVTISGNQSLSNKTLSSPVLEGTVVFGNVNLTSAIGGGPINVTMPTISGRLITDQDGVVGLVTTGKIQNGTILDEDIAPLTITGSKIENGTLSNAKLQNSTISGVALGSNLNTLTITSEYLSVNPLVYDGSSAVNASLNINVTGTPDNIGDTLVSRDVSGNFSAAQINVETLVASGTITAQDFNSTSDINLKTNVIRIEDAMNMIQKLDGVRFNWKKDNLPAMGVIAQELEKVAPELVHTVYGNKCVNYNGIIGILIEAIKELKSEVDDLKSKS